MEEEQNFYEGDSDSLKPLPKNQFIAGSSINEYRDSLVESYRGKGHTSVIGKIRERNPDTSSDEILSLIIEEILDGGEEMLGTQLLFAEEGNLAASTTTIVKRSELLKAVADIVAKKKELAQRASDIDLNSPAFMIFQKLCFDYMMETLEELEVDEELIALIVQKWSEHMKDWGKELKKKLEDMAQ